MINSANRTIIQAGGGLVENDKGEVLIMFRRGKWDLPKGKRDPGESLEECAIREVEEETGISGLELKKFLLVTRHDYEERGMALVKETHWWLMNAHSDQPLRPQTEEDIIEVRWIGISDLPVVLQNTYPGIIEVLRAAGIGSI